MNKKKLTEADIRTKFITPALVGVDGKKWNIMTQIREEIFFTKGPVLIDGKAVSRGEAKKADYILYYKPNIPIAVIEAKDNNHSVGAGMQQALAYAEILDLPFAYSSNGDAFLEHDRTRTSGRVEREIRLDQFPTPDELWSRYHANKGYSAAQEAITKQEYYNDGSGKAPRYYQLIAINRTVDAIARGLNRILLVMATGTGKTYTAFQIIWRLWKSGAKKRILFLVDRNILADQTKTNDFKPFGPAMTKITNRTVDKAFEIYLALYQAVTGIEEEQNIYKQFSPHFFDLVVVDECHRGSAADDAAWRRVLEYFSSATQIGMTATPKETEDVSNIEYFGEPIYQYSLRRGIADGFLAPYKVVRIDLDKDLEGWRPTKGQTDKHNREIEDRTYTARDFDRNIVLEKRTKLVAAKITEFLKATDRFAKTIIFCEDIEHAERMRQEMVNANPDLAAADKRYVMRITGDEGEGKAQLDNFIDPESTFPVIVTTSRLMSTGVDSQTCRLIVLDRHIESQTEFKQIIGRGTRINEDYNKFFFTIMDFKRATSQFLDPNFDGEPVQVDTFSPTESLVPSGEKRESIIQSSVSGGGLAALGTQLRTAAVERTRKYYINDVEVHVVAETVQFFDENGRPTTALLKDYTRKVVREIYPSLESFLDFWNRTEPKQSAIEQLGRQGILVDELAESIGRDYDPFDLVCKVAFDQPALTRRERAETARRRNLFAKYGEKVRAILNALLQKYADSGIRSIESLEILKVDPLPTFGTPVEIVKLFGGKTNYLSAIRELTTQIYQPTI